MPEPHLRALGAVVQESRDQHVRIIAPAGHQARDQVQRVPSVGNWHASEERPGVGRQEAARQIGLIGPYPRPQVADELLEPMHLR